MLLISSTQSTGNVLAALSTVLYPIKPNPMISLEYHEDKKDGDIYLLQIPVDDVQSVLKKVWKQLNFK